MKIVAEYHRLDFDRYLVAGRSVSLSALAAYGWVPVKDPGYRGRLLIRDRTAAIKAAEKRSICPQV